MSVTLRSFILGIFLIISSALIYRYTSINEQSDDDIMKNYPSFISEDFQISSYDKDGSLLYNINTKDIKYYKNDDFASLTGISLIAINKKGVDNPEGEKWSLKSNKAEVKFNDYAILHGDVIIEPMFENSNIGTIKSSNIKYDFKNNIISSNETISISGQDYHDQGDSFELDLNTKILKITGNTHATFKKDTQ